MKVGDTVSINTEIIQGTGAIIDIEGPTPCNPPLFLVEIKTSPPVRFWYSNSELKLVSSASKQEWDAIKVDGGEYYQAVTQSGRRLYVFPWPPDAYWRVWDGPKRIAAGSSNSVDDAKLSAELAANWVTADEVAHLYKQNEALRAACEYALQEFARIDMGNKPFAPNPAVMVLEDALEEHE